MPRDTRQEKLRAMKLFAQRLRHVREAVLRWTQAELADRCAWHHTAVSQLESGTRLPSFYHLVLICKVMDVSADYFAGFSEEPKRLRGSSHVTA